MDELQRNDATGPNGTAPNGFLDADQDTNIANEPPAMKTVSAAEPIEPTPDGDDKAQNWIAANLLPHHLQHLRESGLANTTIAKARLRSVTDSEEARATLRWMPSKAPPGVPAIAFPYGDGSYVRLRPDSPRVDKNKRPIKYEAPLAEPFQIYIPDAVAPGILDHSLELWITEGEKKALASCQAGLPTVAVAGVDCFHDKEARDKGKGDDDNGWTLHPQLAILVGSKRVVTIVFDSDLDGKQAIQWSAARAIRMLRGAQAMTHIAFIEPGAGGQKLGIDDLYVRLGQDAAKLRDAIEKGKRPTEPGQLLEWMGERWSDWDALAKQRELRRAIWIVKRTGVSDEYERWRNDALATLHLTKKNVKALEDELRSEEAFARAKQGNADGSRDDQAIRWFDAPGFAVLADGVYTTAMEKGEEVLGTKIAVAPMNVTEVAVDERGEHYCTVRFMHGREEVVHVARRRLLAGPELLELSALGAPITAANRAYMQQFLAAQEQACLDTIPHIRVITQIGWAQNLDRFVLGRHVLGGDGRALVEADGKFLDGLQQGGDERAHRDLMIEARRASLYLELGEAAGAAAPLMRLLQLRSMLLSLWGASGGGKSASQALAASYYGRPEQIKITGNMTATALEASLARHRDLMLFLDDTQLTQNHFLLDQIAYQIGAGVGRARGTASGGMQPLKDWLCIGFVSGEHPLLRLGIAQGARNRTVELEFEPLRAGLAQELHRELNLHHGHTGPKLLRALMDRVVRPGRLPQLREYFRMIARALSDQPDEKTHQLALLATGAAMSRIFVFDEDEHDATAAAIKLGRALAHRLRTDVDVGVDAITAGYEKILAFVAENQADFVDSGFGQRRRLGAFINGPDERRYAAILGGPLEKYAKENKFNLLEVIHGLRARGKLLLGEKKGDGHRLQRKVGDLAPSRAYCVELPDPPKLRVIEHIPGMEEVLDLLTLWAEDEEAAARDVDQVERGQEGPLPKGLRDLTSALFVPVAASEASRSHVEAVESLLPTPEYQLIERRDDVGAACELLARRGAISLTLNNDGDRCRWLTLGAADKSIVFDLVKLAELPGELRDLIEGGIPKVIDNGDRALRRLMAEFEIEPTNVEDLYAASVLADGYVRERNASEHGLVALGRRHLHRLVAEIGADGIAAHALQAAALIRLRDPLHATIDAADVHRAWKLENDVIAPIASIENGSFHLDTERAQRIQQRAADFADNARQNVIAVIGDVNLRSEDELRRALSKVCGFAFTTTTALHLRRLAKAHPFLLELIKYRRGALYAHTIGGWLGRLGPDGRLHPTIESLGAATGRMTVSDPPLHNVPSNVDVRACLRAAPGNKLVIADYAAIELAIIADRIGDLEMRRCLQAAIDLHRRTAAHLFGKHLDQITDQERRLAKPINFGLVYGMGTETLIEYAEEAYGVVLSPAFAETARNGFFRLYRGVDGWHRRTRVNASTTKEIRSASRRLRRFDEAKFTELLNTPIQGTGADGFKRAVALVYPAIRRLGGRLVHLHHDEIVAEVPEPAAEMAAGIIRQQMLDGMSEFVREVPITVKMVVADTWAKP